MAGRMAGKSAIIVGAAGGIGSATAALFRAEGATLVLLDTDAERGRSLAAALGSPGRVRFVTADAGDEASVEAAFREADEFFAGRLDVLVHIAGGSGRRHGDGPLHECTADGWDRTLAANLRSVFLTNREALRRMITQTRDGAGQAGSIANVASVLALAPVPRHFSTHAYAAAKAGVIGMSRAAAAEYGSLGVRVNVLAPGLIDTPMARRACNDPAIRAYLAAKQPLPAGPGTAEDCAAALLSLCEPAARLITGVVLTADGGWSVSEGT